jgi:hypothetical protein
MEARHLDGFREEEEEEDEGCLAATVRPYLLPEYLTQLEFETERTRFFFEGNGTDSFAYVQREV